MAVAVAEVINIGVFSYCFDMRYAYGGIAILAIQFLILLIARCYYNTQKEQLKLYKEMLEEDSTEDKKMKKRLSSLDDALPFLAEF